MVLDAARSGDAPAIAVRHIGPALLFERLWQETGCQDVIAGLARKRGHHFTADGVIDQRLKRRRQIRLVRNRALTSPTGPADPTGNLAPRRAKLSDAAIDRIAG